MKASLSPGLAVRIDLPILMTWSGPAGLGYSGRHIAEPRGFLLVEGEPGEDDVLLRLGNLELGDRAAHVDARDLVAGLLGKPHGWCRWILHDRDRPAARRR